MALFEVRFKPLESKILLEFRICSKPNIAVAGNLMDEVDKFVIWYWHLIRWSYAVSSVFTHTKAKLTFAELEHLRCQHDLCLLIRVRVCGAPERLVLLCGSET